MKNSSYYIAPVGDRTHDLPHTVASNMVKVSHALNHSATEAYVSHTRISWYVVSHTLGTYMLVHSSLPLLLLFFRDDVTPSDQWSSGQRLMSLLVNGHVVKV